MGEIERRRRRLRPPSAAAPVPAPPPAGSPHAAPPVAAPPVTPPPDVPAPTAPGVRPPRGRPTSGAGVGGDDQGERGLRGLVGSGSSQVSVGAAMRARDAARPTDEQLTEAEANLTIVRRNWRPREDLPRGR